MTLLRLFVTISLHKISEDNLNERDDYRVPFSEQQYIHRPCCISLFKYKSFDQSDPPESPQILDIYSVVLLWEKIYGQTLQIFGSFNIGNIQVFERNSRLCTLGKHI